MRSLDIRTVTSGTAQILNLAPGRSASDRLLETADSIGSAWDPAPDLCFRFHYFAPRRLYFLLRAKALVAFPGGRGTLDELFEAWTLTLIQTRKIDPIPVVLIGKIYWRRVFDIDDLPDKGVIDAEDLDLFWYAEETGEISRHRRCNANSC